MTERPESRPSSSSSRARSSNVSGSSASRGAVRGPCRGGGQTGRGRGRSHGGPPGGGPPVRRQSRSGRGGGDNKRGSLASAEAARAEVELLEQQRKRKEEEEAAAAAKVEAERIAEMERREKIQSHYEASVQSSISVLEAFVKSATFRQQVREQLDTQVKDPNGLSPLIVERQLFEQTKKTLKSDLKKCTAFVKKIKSGSYPTKAELTSPNSPIRTLNLTRYVEEVVAALLEPAQSKIKLGDVPDIVMLCVEMHRRYEGFSSALIPSLLAMVAGTHLAASSAIGGEGEEPIQRRMCFRLLTEFVLHGIITDVKPFIKIISEVAGAPSSSQNTTMYTVTDANIIVTLAKIGGQDLLGVVPRSVRMEYERLLKEIAEKERKKDSIMGAVEINFSYESSPALSELNHEKKKTSSTSTHLPMTTTDLDSTFIPALSNDLFESATTIVEAYKSIRTSSKAIPPTSIITLHTHCLGAYRSLSQSYLATHRRLIKLEKRCDQDRLLLGNLPDAREKGLKDAQILLENLKKSVESLSEALDVDLPILVSLEDEDENGDATNSKGITLWTKNENDPTEEEREARLGPFDDEETRSFYCDIPDLLATKPPALLGINPNDLEKQKEKNARIGFGLTEGDETAVIAMEVDDVETNDGDLDDADEGTIDDASDGKVNGDTINSENKETPHYKLMVLLEQELPEASRREKIDELAERFCVTHGSNKNSRKRLYKTLFLVPRTRLDLLPYYSRFAAILDRVYSDSTLVEELEQQMHGQTKFKKNQNIESRFRTARYLSELTKFRVAPPIVILRSLKRCLEDFTGYNIDVACCMLEHCGRYLYRMKHTNQKVTEMMETMMRIKKARNLDERHVAMIDSAIFMVNPPIQTSQPSKEVTPLEAYLRHLLTSRLQADDESVSFVSKQIQRLPWSDPTFDCGSLVCKYMMKACRKGRYKATKAVASLAAKLKQVKPEIAARLIDSVLEEIQWFLENPNFRDHQRTLVCARIFGELFCVAVISSLTVFQITHHILNFGHNIPDALRRACDSQEVFASRSTVIQTIREDEELNDDDDVKEKQDEVPIVIPVSRYATYDPRVFCRIDPPTASFRVKLVTTILDTVSSHIVTLSNKAKIDSILASLQRYLFVKTSLPSDVEFSVLDLFDVLDSQLRKLHSLDNKQKPQSKESAYQSPPTTFIRYTSWLEAHKFVVAEEETHFFSEVKANIKLLAQAGLLGEQDASTGDLLDEDTVGSVEMTDEEEESLTRGDSLEGDFDEEEEESVVVSADDIALPDESESDSPEEESEEPSNDEEEIDEVAIEAAYRRQLQDEAFESELRKLTIDALEKGKVSARTLTGGKVSSQMPAAPQFVAKKSNSDIKPHERDTSQPHFDGAECMYFKLLKKGNKGKVEEKQLVVPSNTSLARHASKQDDEAAKERDMLKARVLQYEAESAELRNSGGNVYLDETKLQVIRNRPLTMDAIDSNFGRSKEAPYRLSDKLKGRGRGGGRLFNPGRG